jgi:DNA-binding Lrp family transcriptional regulator
LIAIVLIRTKAGRAFSACERIRKIKGVVNVHVVTGPYDIISIVDSKNVSLRSLVATIHEVNGVIRTETCLKVS